MPARNHLHAVFVIALFFMVVSPAVAGVSVSLQPPVTTTQVSQLITVYVHVDSAGSPFNGYEAVIRWDPAVLQFVSVQQEALFGHYANTWWAPEIFPDHVLISHVILEGGATETGPGDLSSITFRAASLGNSPVAFDYIEFYRFGDIVSPVVWHDAIVRVVDPTSGADDGDLHGVVGILLRVAPNPVQGDGRIIARLPEGTTGMLRVLDVSGREIWTESLDGGSLIERRLSPLAHMNQAGTGIYFVQVQAGGRQESVRFLRIDK